MSVTAARTVLITYSGDVTGTETLAAASNATSPGSIETFTLVPGTNIITVPTGGSTPTAMTIVPPALNVKSMTLKGALGDAGIMIHPTDPTSMALDSTVSSFVIYVSCPLCAQPGNITGLRIYWT